MNKFAFPFLPGSPPAQPGPLARYLPPLPEGVAEAWLARQFGAHPAGAAPWVLDPFGASPRLAVEMARQGWRVLVAANNPIARFLLEMTANPPTQTEMQSVLADLAAAPRGSERIEPHLRSLYTTFCAGCGQRIMAQAFLWERGASAPYARIYLCPHCGDSGEYPVTDFDIEHAHQHTASGLHRSRALERVSAPDDPDRTHVEEALEVYPPRAVYALFTLINKLDGLNLSNRRRDCLAALLLSACDQANTLWSHPAARERPRQLTVPPRYRENNIWLALEQSIDRWVGSHEPVPFSVWPTPPPESGGLCIYEGRLKDLLEDLAHQGHNRLPIQAVVTALPRPNQAFWTLSALWAGWLWGREAVGPFRSVLRRRRYDWAWHTAGLAAALSSLAQVLPDGTSVLALAAEAEPGLLTAALGAGQFAGLQLTGLSLCTEPAQAQITWQRPIEPETPSGASNLSDPLQAASDWAQQFLEAYGQPAEYLQMHAAGLIGLLYAGFFKPGSEEEDAAEKNIEPTPAQKANQAANLIRQAVNYRGGFLRYNAGEAAEIGQWWLRDSEQASQSLLDRSEIALVRYLIKNPGCSFIQIEDALNQEFTGLLTPDQEFIEVCLDSYGMLEAAGGHTWKLRPQEQPALRRQDLARVQAQLEQLGSQLGLLAQGQSPLLWLDAQGAALHGFYPLASAIFTEIMLGKKYPLAPRTRHPWIVLPGGRANLALFKLRRDPRLKSLSTPESSPPAEKSTNNEAAPSRSWGFIKFRHLQWLIEHPLTSLNNLEELLHQDPLTFTAPQMRLF